MHKHAYLITAHHQFTLLCRLIKMIDDERNDIYIHIDKKAKN
ncbi:glycosyl transferase, partial [Lactiplantibacillus garii]